MAVARGEGFRLEDITPPGAHLARRPGRNDPVAMAHAQERRLPRVNASYCPQDGQLIFYSRIDEILTELAAR